ncbi:hypothetical protein OH76DRAFT_785038 [Lentinus brumalis]|uniref:Uncharacterized protein n=1 Tax=Lentinus brumalis TaxID=2498619 RepID=A0A371D3V3_9APHY|nr:hypothetical protein OH76DRAFT_785038 [Polyporus brumalis]
MESRGRRAFVGRSVEKCSTYTVGLASRPVRWVPAVFLSLISRLPLPPEQPQDRPRDSFTADSGSKPAWCPLTSPTSSYLWTAPRPGPSPSPSRTCSNTRIPAPNQSSSFHVVYLCTRTNLARCLEALPFGRL